MQLMHVSVRVLQLRLRVRINWDRRQVLEHDDSEHGPMPHLEALEPCAVDDDDDDDGQALGFR
jgi:hypothetical protein